MSLSLLSGLLLSATFMSLLSAINVAIMRVFFIFVIRNFTDTIMRGLKLEINLTILISLISLNFVSETPETIVPKESV